LVDDAAAGLYNADDDELVVGAHIVSIMPPSSGYDAEQTESSTSTTIPTTSEPTDGLSLPVREDPIGSARGLKERGESVSPEAIPRPGSGIGLRFTHGSALFSHSTISPAQEPLHATEESMSSSPPLLTLGRLDATSSAISSTAPQVERPA
jgi:hypothetical protein